MGDRDAIRVLIAKPGLDGHDRGVKVLVKGLMDAGMEVIYAGRHQRIRSIAATAAEEDVDVVGLSILSGTHVEYCTRLVSELNALGVTDTVLLVGGTISGPSVQEVEALGFHVFPVGSKLPNIVETIRTQVALKRGGG